MHKLETFLSWKLYSVICQMHSFNYKKYLVFLKIHHIKNTNKLICSKLSLIRVSLFSMKFYTFDVKHDQLSQDNVLLICV